MKKFLTLLFFTLLLNETAVQSQIPNRGFENLNSDGTVSNWGNVYLFSAGIIDSSGVFHLDSIIWDNYFYAPSSDAHSGTGAIELRNAYDYTTNTGIAGSVSADADSVFSSWSTFEIVTVSAPPTDLSFYYKYFPVNNDTAVARLGVYDSTMNMIGEATAILSGSASSYTYSSTPVNYILPGAAAFVSINFSTFYTDAPGLRQCSLGTRLLIDDVSINSVTGIDAATGNGNIIIYPNPATAEINFNFPHNPVSEIEIINTSGECSNKTLIQNKLDVSSLPCGIYYLKVKQEDKIYRGKFVKK